MRKRVLVALAAAAMLVLLPTAAWAHHPEITAELDCDGLLTWTASAWETEDQDARIHNDVTVTLIKADGTTEPLGEGKFTAENDFTLSGDHELGLDAGPVRVKVTVNGPWDNGVDPPAEKDTNVTGEITPPTDCAPEPTNPEPTNPEPTTPEPTTPEPTTPEPTTPEPTTPEPTTPEPTTPETTTAPPVAPPAAPPGGGVGLPQTGAGTAPVLLSIAAGLIAAGGTAVYLARRRSGAGAES